MKKWIKYISAFAMLLFGLSMTQLVSAETMFPNGQILQGGREQEDYGLSISYRFQYDGQSVYLGYVDVYDVDEDADINTDIELSIQECDNIYAEPIEFVSLGKNMQGFVYAGNEALKFGQWYEVSIRSATWEGGDIKYRIEKYRGYAENVKIQEPIELEIGDTKKINYQSISPYGSLPEINWNSPESRVVSIDDFGNVTAKSKGNYVLRGTLRNGKEVSCKLNISTPAPYINYYAYTLCRGETAKLEICYENRKIKWSSSNKKIATVTASGKVKAKKIGKCTITAKVGKKKYTCKIKVTYRNPNFGAILTGYNTRNNYFTVKYKNWGDKPVYIKPNNAKVEDVDYKRFDRKLRLSGGKTIKIKPKKSVTLRFYVRGSVSWYNYRDYTLIYKFSYDGKQYEGHVWDEDSSYKRGKKWYGTYWSDYEDKYLSWIAY